MCGVCVTVIVPVTSTVNPPTDNNIDPDCSGSFILSGAVRVTGVPGAIDENTPVLPIPTTGVPENAVTCVALASRAFNKALTSMIVRALPSKMLTNPVRLNVSSCACAEDREAATATAASIARRDFDNFIMMILAGYRHMNGGVC